MKRITQKCVLLLFCLAILTSTAHAAEVALKVLDGVELHAFASSSYTFNFNQPTQRPPNSATNVNRIFDADHNSFKFDVGELVILRDTPNPGDVGFRTDLTYGFSVPEDVGFGEEHSAAGLVGPPEEKGESEYDR